MCTYYIKLLFNRLIQNMFSVPEVDNGLARFLYRTQVKQDLFEAGPAIHYCQQYSLHGKYQPIYIGTHKIQIQILHVLRISTWWLYEWLQTLRRYKRLLICQTCTIMYKWLLICSQTCTWIANNADCTNNTHIAGAAVMMPLFLQTPTSSPLSSSLLWSIGYSE